MKTSTINPRPLLKKDKPNLVFKVFFDPDSKRCLHKTTGDNVGDLPFVIVDHSTYTNIDSCDNYQVVNGQIEKSLRSINYKKLMKTDHGNFTTTKNNMIFVVTDRETDKVDHWDYYKK